jgi:WD40 repeat protein
MDVRFVGSFSGAESFITSLNFAPHVGATDELLALAAAEDDHLRLYDLDFPQLQNDSNNSSPPSFLVADYDLPATGCDQAVFTQGNTHCLVAPRLRRDHQIYCLNLETAAIVASYHCPAQPNYQDPLETRGFPQADAQPWFGSLVVHPTAPGVFAAQGDGAIVNFFSASVAVPVARIGAACKGRAVIAFAPRSGNYFAVGDAETIGVYDWRRLGAASSGSGSAAAVPAAILHAPVKSVVRAARWLQDVGHVSGLDFHPADEQQLLVTTSRSVVRTLDAATGAPLHSFGASGAAASHLPNERPQALANKRSLTAAAKFSPDGAYVAVGSLLRRVCIFETPTAEATASDAAANTSDASSSGAPAVLSHVLHGQHCASVSTVSWCPRVPVLVSTCKNGNMWRFCASSAAAATAAPTANSSK